jgi:Protein of unknown function (DUF3293)
MCIAMLSSTDRAAQREPVPPRLLRAYRMTWYRAGGFDIVIGHRVPDGLFAWLGAPNATLLTAWNPQSRRMPNGWNRRIQRQLRQCLRRFRSVEAEGSLHCWHEPMLLVAGDPRPMVRLAARFRQRAVVMLRRGRRARLWLR